MEKFVPKNVITKHLMIIITGVIITASASAQTYTTRADGNWSSPSTWVGGIVPSATIAAGKTVTIKNNVTFDLNSDISVAGVFNLNDTLTFAPTYGKTFKVTQGGLFYVKNGAYMQSMSTASSDMTLDRGRIVFENSVAYISKGFLVTKGGKRTLKNSKMYLGGSYDLDGGGGPNSSVDTIQNSIVEMAMLATGDFRVRNQNTLRVANAYIKVDNGNNFINDNGATINVLPGANSNYGFDLLKISGDLQNDGAWVARIDAACIGGTIKGSQMAAIDFTRAQDCGVAPAVGNAPELIFKNAVLKSGPAKKQGAVYRFANVMTGVDAEIKLKKFSRNDIVMQDVDLPSLGWDKAFQPQFGLAGMVQPFQNWYIDFELKFYQAGTNTIKQMPKVDMTALDVDGDNVSVSEYAVFQNPSNVIYSTVSYLADQPAGALGQSFTCPIDGLLSPLIPCPICGGDGKTGIWNLTDCTACDATGMIFSLCNHAYDETTGNTLQGPVENFTNIDTAATQVMATYQYTDVNTIDFRYGARSGAQPSNGAGIRLNSLWFRQFNLAPPSILPVTISNFSAFLSKNNVDLNWTGYEENFSHYVLQRSTDGVNYSDAAVVFANENTSVSHYNYRDENVASATGILYYRLKMIDKTKEAKYSDIRLIRLGKEKETIQLTTYPNPVTEQVRVTLPAAWQGRRVVLELYSSNGVRIQSTPLSSASQTETIQMGKVSRGFYVVKASCDGQVAQQQVVKN